MLMWHGISDLAAEEKQVSSNQSGSRTNTYKIRGPTLVYERMTALSPA